MDKFLSKATFLNPIILSSIGAVVVIAIGSAIYYHVSTEVPAVIPEAPVATSTPIVGNGVVDPAQNPNLAFQSGGRVADISVAVGDTVYAGEVLATLDNAQLQAQLDQASADVASQQAQLAQMQIGPRQVDIESGQTAVSQASTTLVNFYASIPANIAQAYDESFSGVSGDTDTLFSGPDTASPSLIFSTINNQLAVNAVNDRSEVNGFLSTWSTEANALSENSSTGDIDAALKNSIANLEVVRTYSDDLLLALGNAVPSGTFSASSIASAQASVATLRDTVNGLILSLQGEQQQIASDELAIQSAQDSLNETLAGSTPQAIEAQAAQVAAAQANVENYQAQIADAVVVAPFAGTVASVQVQVGDIVPPNTVAISLNPNSPLQIDAYFSELQVTQIQLGAQAQVTLDAYGNSEVFPAQVITVDTSPSQDPSQPTGVLGYKVTLQFAKSDPAITSGMTANVTISTQ